MEKTKILLVPTKLLVEGNTLWEGKVAVAALFSLALK